MNKNIYPCLAISLLMITVACHKEIESGLSPDLSSSFVNARQPLTPHFIGEHFGGGVIFYLDQSGRHGLIAALADIEEAAHWSRKDTLNGAKDTALGAGAVNTRKIVNIQGFPRFEADTYAALECMGLNDNGYQDWYLPSINELNKMHENKAVIGGLRDISYWSSSELNATKAWSKNFSNGALLLQFKTASYALRPIRKF